MTGTEKETAEGKHRYRYMHLHPCVEHGAKAQDMSRLSRLSIELPELSGPAAAVADTPDWLTAVNWSHISTLASRPELRSIVFGCQSYADMLRFAEDVARTQLGPLCASGKIRYAIRRRDSDVLQGWLPTSPDSPEPDPNDTKGMCDVSLLHASAYTLQCLCSTCTTTSCPDPDFALV